MELTPVGIDIAKNVFQVHYVDEATGAIVNRQIKRAKFLEFFVNRSPCLIGMQACGGAHHWARQLTQMGHQVKLMPARLVKAFNIRNKNDAGCCLKWRMLFHGLVLAVVGWNLEDATVALGRLGLGESI